MFGAAEWFAQRKSTANSPVGLYGDGQQQAMAYAAQPGKPHWLLSAFPQDLK
jgi:hypothetical protein